MIHFTIRDLMAGRLNIPSDHCVYVFHNRKVVFYVGKSTDKGGIAARLYSYKRRQSLVNILITKSLEESLTLDITALTIEDCHSICSRTVRKAVCACAVCVANAEEYLITHYRPCLNMAGSYMRTELPIAYQLPLPAKLLKLPVVDCEIPAYIIHRCERKRNEPILPDWTKDFKDLSKIPIGIPEIWWQ